MSRTLPVYALAALVVPLGLLGAAPQAVPAPAHPAGFKPALPAELRTRILVLGSPHLGALASPPSRADLEPLLAVLQRFEPAVIAIERIPPAVLVDLNRRGGFMAEVANQFGETHLRIASLMQERLALSFAEAAARVDRTLWGGMPASAAARERLIAEMLAACEYESAVLQWGYLSTEDRVAAAPSLLPPAIVAELDNGLVAPNEIISVAATLARRIGVQRLMPVDDQTDAAIFAEIAERFPGELEKIAAHAETKALSRTPLGARSDALFQMGRGGPEGLLPFYRFINSTEATTQDAVDQWGRYFRMRLASGVDRARASQWEVRNLRIAANVRQASALHPGGKILVVIGSAHKPFLDRYLAEMLDVEVVHLESLLAPAGSRK